MNLPRWVSRMTQGLPAWSRKLTTPTYLVVLAVALAALTVAYRPSDAAIGGAIAVATLIASQGFDALRRRSEEQRWHAQRFLDHKIESTRALAAAYSRWRRELNYHGNFPPADFAEFQRVLGASEAAFMEAFATASVYLTPEVDSVIAEAMGVCRLAQRAVFHSIPGNKLEHGGALGVFPWEKFIATGTAAAAALNPLLYPQSLRDLEHKLGL